MYVSFLGSLALNIFQIYILPSRKGARGTFPTLATGKQHVRVGRAEQFPLDPQQRPSLLSTHSGDCRPFPLPPTTISAATSPPLLSVSKQ